MVELGNELRVWRGEKVEKKQKRMYRKWLDLERGANGRFLISHRAAASRTIQYLPFYFIIINIGTILAHRGRGAS